MKNTKKNLVKIADVKFTIFRIKEDGSRGLQYGGLSGIAFVKEMMNISLLGVRSIIVKDEDAFTIYREVYGSVSNNSQTDTGFYDKVRHYGVTLASVVELDY